MKIDDDPENGRSPFLRSQKIQHQVLTQTLG